MRLYGRSFRADRASIILRELGLAHQHLRQHLSKRRKFFDNKERLHKLTSLVSPEDSELDLDRKMLAVVAKADQPELFNILRTLFHSMTGDDAPRSRIQPPGLGPNREIRPRRAVLGDGQVRPSGTEKTAQP